MKKKKLLSIVTVALALCCAMVLAVGCTDSSDDESGSSDEATEEETEEEAEEESTDYGEGFTLIVGFDSGYPPYGFIGDDGEYTGFDLELAAAVCDYYGWELELEPIDWDAKDALLGSGAINCIWNGFTIEGREDDYTFSEAYMLNEQVIVVRADSGIESLEDLAGLNVVTQVDSAALDVLESDDYADFTASLGELSTLSDYNNAFMQLESGAVDAVACDLSIANYQMSANEDTYVIIETLSSEHYGVGFNLGDEELAELVTEALIALDEEGFVEELCEEYSDYGISYDNWVL